MIEYVHSPEKVLCTEHIREIRKVTCKMRMLPNKNGLGERRSRENEARRAGFAASGLKGADMSMWDLLRRLCCAVLALCMMLNTCGIAADSVALADALVVEEDVAALDEFEIGLSGEEATHTGGPKTYTYELEGEKELMLSDILKAIKLDISLKKIVEVTVLGSMEEDVTYLPGTDRAPTELLSVTRLENDYRVTVLQGFDEAGIAVYTDDGMFVIRFIDVVAEAEDLNTLSAEDSADIETEENGLEFEYEAEAPAFLSYCLGDQRAMLSDILKAVELPLKLMDVEEVGQLEDDDGAEDVLGIQAVGEDYRIYALEDFDEVELAVCTQDDIYTVLITDGRVFAPQIQEQTPVGADVEQTEVDSDGQMLGPNGLLNDDENASLPFDEDAEEASDPEEQPYAEAPDDDALIVIGPAVSNEATYNTPYMRIELTGGDYALARLIEARVDAGPGQRVEEAYAIVESEACLGIAMEITALPDAGEGEYTEIYGLLNGRLSDFPLTDPLKAGEGCVLPVAEWEGFALVRHVEREFQMLPPELVGDAVVEMSGVLPVGGSVRATVAEGDENALFACDIAIFDAQGNAFCPAQGSPLAVTVASDDIREALDAGEELRVLVRPDDAEALEDVELLSDGDGEVTFAAMDSGTYLVLSEAQEALLAASAGPRLAVHFIDWDARESAPGVYTAPAYQVPDGLQDTETDRILISGDSLSLIPDPMDRVTSGSTPGFYGWCVVDIIEENSEGITYSWPEKLVRVPFGQPFTIDDMGDELAWRSGAALGRASMNGEGGGEIYLAPVYEDFRFVNFHGEDGLLCRRMAFNDGDDACIVRIGDVKAPVADVDLRRFKGWKTGDGEAYYQTLDDNGNEIDMLLNTDGTMAGFDGEGYWITLGDADALTAIDLYPIIDDIRWVHFDTGEPDDGVEPIPSEYLRVNDNGEGTCFYALPVCERSGYDFLGWFTDSDADFNGTDARIADGNGNFTDSALGLVVTDGDKKCYEVTPDGELYVYSGLSGEGLRLYARWKNTPRLPAKVTFRVADQAGAPVTGAVFDLEHGQESLGEALTSDETGKFLEMANPFVGALRLTQTLVPEGYIGLEAVTLRVTEDGISVDNTQDVTVTGNADDGFVVTVANYASRRFAIECSLNDPLEDGAAFSFDVEILIGDRYSRRTLMLSPRNGSYDSASIDVPLGAALTVTERDDGMYSRYDIVVDGEQSPTRTVVVEFDAAMRFVNTRKQVTVTVGKASNSQPEREYPFTASLSYGGTPVAYGAFAVGDNDGGKTYADVRFALKNGETMALTVPVEALLTVEQAIEGDQLVTVSADNDSEDLDPAGNIFSFHADRDTVLTFIDVEPNPICLVGTEGFRNLRGAVRYIEENGLYNAVIEMLTDYTVEPSDAIALPEGYDITLTSGSMTGDFEDSSAYATLTRSEALTGPMITNAGTLTLAEIAIDGGDVPAEAAMIVNSGTLNVTDGARLENANRRGDGGAIYVSRGVLNLTGGSLTDNHAYRGAAIFVSAGTANISGGEVRRNRSNGGAIAVGGEDARLNFSGAPVVYGNKKSFDEDACNVYLNVDSSDIIHAGGLVIGAHIGVYAGKAALRDHNAMYAPFGRYGTSEGGIAENLDLFVNDITGMRGAARTDDQRIVWLKLVELEVQKAVEDAAGDKTRAFTFAYRFKGRGEGHSYGWIEEDVSTVDSEAQKYAATAISGAVAATAGITAFVIHEGMDAMNTFTIRDGEAVTVKLPADERFVLQETGDFASNYYTEVESAQNLTGFDEEGAPYVDDDGKPLMNDITKTAILELQDPNTDSATIKIKNTRLLIDVTVSKTLFDPVLPAETEVSFPFKWVMKDGGVTKEGGLSLSLAPGGYASELIKQIPMGSQLTVEETLEGDQALLYTGGSGENGFNFGNTRNSVKAKIVKVDEQGRPLAGSRFDMTVKGNEEAEIEGVRVDDAGGVLFDGPLYYGADYGLAETRAPVGYKALNGNVILTVDPRGRLTALVHESDRVTVEGSAEEGYLISIYNEPNPLTTRVYVYDSSKSAFEPALIEASESIMPWAAMTFRSIDRFASTRRHNNENLGFAFAVVRNMLGGVSAISDLRTVNTIDTLRYARMNPDDVACRWQYRTAERDAAWTDIEDSAVELYYFRLSVDFDVLWWADRFRDFSAIDGEQGFAMTSRDRVGKVPLGQRTIRLTNRYSVISAEGEGAEGRYVLPASIIRRDEGESGNTTYDYYIEGFDIGPDARDAETVKGLDAMGTGEIYLLVTRYGVQMSRTPRFDDEASAYINGSALHVLYGQDAVKLELTKEWLGVENANYPQGYIEVEFYTGEGDERTIVPMSRLESDANGDTRKGEATYVTGSGDRVVLKTANGAWPTWTVYVPNMHVPIEVREVDIDGFVTAVEPAMIPAGDEGKAKIVNSRAICKITYAVDEKNRAFYKAYTTLEDAFIDVNTSEALEGKRDIRIEMLTEFCELTQGVSLAAGKTVTLTSAARKTVDENDHYTGFYNGATGTACSIRRKGNYDSMIAVSGNLTLEGVVLNGVGDSYTGGNGSLVNIADGGSLTIGKNAELRDARSTGDGGAVYVGDGATMNLTTGIIAGNSTSGSGAGVYVAAGGRLEMSGKPEFGEGNFADMEGFEDRTNGLERYARPRQDIYLAGDGERIESLVVTGAIQVDAGAIWVWPGEAAHHELIKQFAVFADGVAGDMRAVELQRTLRAFRNAVDDASTRCTGEYLTGCMEEEDLDNIYWTGGFNITFTSVNGFGEPLGGTVFGLYQDIDCTQPVMADNAPWTATSGEVGGTDAGQVVFHKVPSGVYYMKALEIPGETRNGQELSYRNGYAAANDAGRNNANVYVVLVGDNALNLKTSEAETVLSGITAQAVRAQISVPQVEGEAVSEDKKFAIFLIGEATASATVTEEGAQTETDDASAGEAPEEPAYNGPRALTTPDIARFGVMNECVKTQRVMLSNIGSGNAPAEGEEFRIRRYDRTPMRQRNADGGYSERFVSDSSGIYFIGDLPYGVYLIEQTASAGGMRLPSHYFVIRVDENGVSNERGNAAKRILPSVDEQYTIDKD